MQCQEIGSPPTPASCYQTQLEGTGVLSNSSFCYAHAENFKLLPHSLGKTTVTLTRTHIVLPNIDDILHFSEEGVLQSDVNLPAKLQRLDEILVRATSRSHTRSTQVARIVTALRDAEVHRQPIHRLWFVSIAIVSIVIGLLWSIWLRPINPLNTELNPICQ